MTRKEADNLFLEGMKAVGVNWFRRRVMYLAVRAGGRRLWGYASYASSTARPSSAARTRRRTGGAMFVLRVIKERSLRCAARL